MKKIKFAMIGGDAHHSLIGPTHYVASHWKNRAELVAGCFSRDPQKSIDSGAVYQLPSEKTFSSIDELLDSGIELDAVIVVTPNSTHVPYAIKALKKNLHVMCEKPLSSSMDRTEELLQTIQKSGRVFCLAHHNTGYAAIRKLKEINTGQVYGSLKLMQGEYTQGWLAPIHSLAGNRQAKWRLDPSISGKSCCFADIGTHIFNLMQFVCDKKIVSGKVTPKTLTTGRKVDDFCHGTFEFEDHIFGIMTASQISVGHDNDIKLSAHFEKASVSWSVENPYQLLIRHPDHRTETWKAEEPVVNHHQKNLLTRVPNVEFKTHNIEAFSKLYDIFFDACENKGVHEIISANTGMEAMSLIYGSRA